MSKPPKWDAMKDNYPVAETSKPSQDAAVQGKTMSAFLSGMRHGIRPRRIMNEQSQKRLLELSAVVPEKPSFVKSAEDTRWQDLSIEAPGTRGTPTATKTAIDSDLGRSDAHAFDVLRTRLRQTAQEHGWTNIAVTAPTTGCGTTFTAVNLALSLSRITGSRSILMDFNMRNPGVAAAVDIQARGPLQEYLGGRTAMAEHLVRCSDTLALGLNIGPHELAAETLQNATTIRTLQQMQSALQPEIVIYDMPPMLAFDDVSAFLPHLDGVLLVSDGTQTTARQLTECEQMLGGQVPLLGVVLNRARRSSIVRYT